MFAGVVIDIPSSNVDQVFDYVVPFELNDIIKVGSRVKVPFGQSNKPILAIVVELYSIVRNNLDKKEILECLDYSPIISLEQLSLAYKIKEEVICPLIRILKLFIPDALYLKSVKYLELNDVLDTNIELIKIFNGKTLIEYNSSLNKYIDLIDQAIKSNIIKVRYDSIEKGSFKYINKYYCDKDYCNNNINLIKSLDKKEFIKDFINHDSLSMDELIDYSGLSIYKLKDLIKKGYLKESKCKISRVNNKLLNNNLEYLYNKSNSLLKENLNNLLYIPQTIEQLNNSIIDLCGSTLSNNKNCLIVCPEILSTYKIASLIRKTFNINVACINSNLSSGEYLDYYDEIKNNEFKVIVTTSKGIFLPFSNIGLIYMLDEESDNYYNDQSPRFDTHDVLNDIKEIFNANLVLESFSPSDSSYIKALSGIYHVYKEEYIDNNEEVIDMIHELKLGNTSSVSHTLKEAIISSLNNFKNTLLIVNNKNYSSFVICKDCGNVKRCDKCGISLKYNEKLNSLLCPSCGYKISYSSICDKCGSTNQMFGGVGMESVYNDIKDITNTKIFILDDNKEASLNEILEYDSNMIVITSYSNSKSLSDVEFYNVGIISLDTSIKSTRFDAYSATYSILTNLSKLCMNKLFIQTTDINHFVLKSFIEGNYNNFIKEDLSLRKLCKYPPFYNLNRIIIKGKYEELFKEANNIKHLLLSISNNNVIVIGPTYSKYCGGVTLIIKHNYDNINYVYKTIYDNYAKTNILVIFDKYPRSL